MKSHSSGMLLFLLVATVNLGSLSVALGDAPAKGHELKLHGATYDPKDVSPFSPSSAIYFMDGYSEATVKFLPDGDQLTFRFEDMSTSVAATAPLVYDQKVIDAGVFLSAPEPLAPIAHFPAQLPAAYRRPTTLHLMQVVSMNMRDKSTGGSLLIGLPYAEKYPELFFRTDLFEGGARSAASFGAVSSLTDYADSKTRRRDVTANGYPARSSFAVFHILETSVGVFFNKKPTVMELQPGRGGKLALSLPPIPFMYKLVNGPIPLYKVSDPNGPVVAEVISAAHGADHPVLRLSEGSWPRHLPNLDEIDAKLKAANLKRQ